MCASASSSVYYISHLTSLLESIALIIDQHQNIVEKYYGQGKMDVVVQRLQVEADGFCKTLVEGWEDERRVGRLVKFPRRSFSQTASPGSPCLRRRIADSGTTSNTFRLPR